MWLYDKFNSWSDVVSKMSSGTVTRLRKHKSNFRIEAKRVNGVYAEPNRCGKKLKLCPPDQGKQSECDQITSSITSLLECPVCLELILPPIFQCANGHLICGDCKTDLPSHLCPTCRIPLCNTRNLCMEKIVETLSIPCKYAPEGCTEQLPYLHKSDHENICPHRPFECPFRIIGCKWEGTELFAHLGTHEFVRIRDRVFEDISFDFGIKKVTKGKNDTWVNVEIFTDCAFFVAARKKQGKLACYVRSLGNFDNLSVRYKIMTSGNGRKQSWTGIPTSDREEPDIEMERNDCFWLPENLVEYFSTNSFLNLTIRIYYE